MVCCNGRKPCPVQGSHGLWNTCACPNPPASCPPTLQLGKKERTLQEVTSPPALQRGRSSSDLALPLAPDGSMTPRGRGEEEQAMQLQLGGGLARATRQRQPSNLGRSSNGGGAGSEGGSRRAVPRLTLPGRQ